MVTRRDVLEFLAAEGCVRGATEVITQQAIQIQVVEKVERDGNALHHRIAANHWVPAMKELAELLRCNLDTVSEFLDVCSRPNGVKHLEQCFELAHRQLGGLQAALTSSHVSGSEVIARAVEIFVHG